MLPDRVSNPGPLTYESGALPIALRGPVALLPLKVYLFTYPAGTWRRIDVDATSLRRIDVNATSFRRYVSAE